MMATWGHTWNDGWTCMAQHQNDLVIRVFVLAICLPALFFWVDSLHGDIELWMAVQIFPPHFQIWISFGCFFGCGVYWGESKVLDLYNEDTQTEP
jgi:hypothetical protein